MGTSLTGLTPATTYDALIKVGDNGPLSATAKVLSDGLGNDSILALSTTAVGIGTTTPLSTLNVQKATSTELSLLYTTNTGNNFTQITGGSSVENFNKWASIKFAQNASNDAHDLIFSTASPTVDTTERGRFTNGGFFRLSANSGGIQFNGDTANANALDDYEEGTWTMGINFGGGSTGVTYTSNTGTYTKIGRQVTVSGYLVLSNKGSSTGIAQITGLPFTIGNIDSFYPSPSLYLNKVTFANQFQGYGNKNATNIDIVEVTEAGIISSLTNADFANNSEIIVSMTYFV